MASVKVICDSNFTKTEDIDKSIGKVLKMFSKHLEKTTAPLSKSSDMECVYLYTKLTPDKVRLMKKMLKSNKTLLHFKKIVVSDDGNESSSSECSIKSISCSVKSACSNSSSSSKSSLNSNSSSDSESPLSKTCSKPFSKKKNSKKATSKKRAFKSDSDDSGSDESRSEGSVSEFGSETECNKRYREISQQLRDLADEIENLK